MDLKNKIQTALIKSAFDGGSITLLKSKHGKIQIECHLEDDIATLEVWPFEKQQSIFKMGHRSFLFSKCLSFKKHPDMASSMHEILCEYLERFEKDKLMMKRFGFKVIGYDWYEYNGLDILKSAIDDSFDFLFDWGDGTWMITHEHLKKTDLFEAIKLFASSDLNHYSILPSRLRDCFSSCKI